MLQEDLVKFIQALDKDGDDEIDYDEFFDAFSVVDIKTFEEHRETNTNTDKVASSLLFSVLLFFFVRFWCPVLHAPHASGCVGVWACGCVGVWACGCVGVWVRVSLCEVLQLQTSEISANTMMVLQEELKHAAKQVRSEQMSNAATIATAKKRDK